MAHGKSLELAKIQPKKRLLIWSGYQQYLTAMKTWGACIPWDVSKKPNIDDYVQLPIRSRKRDFKRWLVAKGADKHIIRKALKQWELKHGEES